jgi:cytochrome c
LDRGSIAVFLTALVSIASCSGPPASSPPPSETKEPTRADAKVDLHGDWERWIETPRMRERALSQLSGLPRFGFGREATAEEIDAIDIDIMPDGTGLPEGKGSVARGKQLYRNQCVQCHGTEGQGADYEALAGREPEDGFPFSDSLSHRVTVGNYWPYATTLYDYIHRAMPQAVPGSLPPDDVYSLVAFVLYLNRIVPEDATLDEETLPLIEMPARDRFVYDDRRGGGELR